MTMAISASRLPESMASAIATKFEPRPESRMPRRLLIGDAGTSCDTADAIPGLLQALQDLRSGVEIAFGNHEDHADAEVERSTPVSIGHVADLLQELKNRKYRP